MVASLIGENDEMLLLNTGFATEKSVFFCRPFSRNRYSLMWPSSHYLKLANDQTGATGQHKKLEKTAPEPGYCGFGRSAKKLRHVTGRPDTHETRAGRVSPRPRPCLKIRLQHLVIPFLSQAITRIWRNSNKVEHLADLN